MENGTLATANPKAKLHWLNPTPGHLLAVLLAVEGILFLANWFHWIPKGWAVLIAVAAVGVFLIVMLLWCLGSLYYPTRRRLLIVLLAFAGILLSCEWWKLFPRDWEIIIHLSAVGLFLLLILLWFTLNCFFRWRFQFSLWSLLVLTVAVAIPASWLTVEMEAAKGQKKAVAAIHALGGKTIYDFRFDQSGRLIYVDLDPFGVRKEPDPPYPKWLLKILGDDFFTGVYYVEFSMPNRQVTNDSLIHVEKLVGLRKLLLQETSVTDAGVSRLQHLPLDDLLFRGELITDDGLKCLVGMNKLSNLWLNDTKISDAGMSYVSQLPNLKFLCLSGTKVGDEGLAQLRNAQQLVWLDLSETPATDTGMGYLRNLKNLHYLNLAGTQITDKGLLALKELSNLEMIKLSDLLPGRGKQLRVNMRQLNTKTTDEGVQKLQKALPKCKIQR